MEGLVQPGTGPFWVAIGTVAGLGAVEALSLLLGTSASGLLDDGLGHHGHEAGPLGAWSSWLNAGGVPFLVLLIAWLSSFAVAGFAIQGAASSIAGPLDPWIASGAALAASLPATRWSTRWIGRAIPRDETSALEPEDFIGLTGSVTIGPLDQGHPGIVIVVDRHGNTHTLRARAAPGHTIATGSPAIIADRAEGAFVAIPTPASMENLT